MLTPSAIGYSTLPLELDRSSFELQRCRLRDHIAQSRLQKDPQPRQIGAMNVMAAAIGLQESIPGDSLAPIRGGSGPAEAAVAPAAGAKGATCYCGEVHTNRPRITPTSEHTRLVEVWISPHLRCHLSQWLQGDSRPAMDAGDGRKSFWMKVAEIFNDPENDFEPFEDEHTTGHFEKKLDAKLKHDRDAEYLKGQWQNVMKQVTEYFKRWTVSGQQDPSNFWDFCQGDRVSYYAMKRLWSANLLFACTKIVPPGTCCCC